jgi:hypothetical protein
MLQRSHLNVYVIGADLSPRQRVQLQAQLESALRALPRWCLDLIRARLEATGAASFPLVIQPQPPDGDALPLSLGHADGRPAAYLRPRVDGDRIDWLQDRRYLAVKAAAHIAAPSAGEDPGFWRRWAGAVRADRLRDHAAAANEAWAEASDRDLLIEMFAAYALNPSHRRWDELPSVRAFLEGWAGD